MSGERGPRRRSLGGGCDAWRRGKLSELHLINRVRLRRDNGAIWALL